MMNIHVVMSICLIVAGEVDAQLHGCLLSMAADQSVPAAASGVTHHVTNFSAAGGGATFTRRENAVANNDAHRRQSMVNAVAQLFAFSAAHILERLFYRFIIVCLYSLNHQRPSFAGRR